MRALPFFEQMHAGSYDVKARVAWLDEHGMTYTFHDYKKSGIDAATLTRWCEQLGWETLVNKRGTTWRKLTPDQQAIPDTAAAIALMQAQPSLIRRPVVEFAGGELVVGLDLAAFERLAGR